MSEVERLLRVEAARLERLFTQAAQRVQLPWSFAVTRGQLLVEAMARAADLTIVGASRRSRAMSPRTGAARGKAGRTVAALFDQGSLGSAARTGDCGPARQERRRGARRFLVRPGDPAAQMAAAAQARAWLAAEHISASVLTLVGGAQTLAGEGLCLRQARLLVDPVPEHTAPARMLEALAAGLPRLLVIVR